MKAIISRSFLATAVTAAVVTFSSFTATAQKANFAGDWKLDESKSELGEFGGRAARALKAVQNDGDITISRTTPGFGGGDPMTTTVTLTFDGKEVESEGFGGSKRKSTAKWSEDGKSLTINTTMIFDRDGQTMEFKSTEVWTLTADGLLSVATTSSSPRGDSSTKAVYTK